MATKNVVMAAADKIGSYFSHKECGDGCCQEVVGLTLATKNVVMAAARKSWVNRSTKEKTITSKMLRENSWPYNKRASKE